MVKDYDSNALVAFDFDNIKKKIPELQLLDCKLDSVSFDDPLDSSDMGPEHWESIASIIEEHYEDKDGFVVLTGTDTMSYSASVISFMLENLDKPVIFTGSQLPIGDLRTDAKENLITAIQVACAQNEKGSVVREVGLYFEYKLYRGNRTTKVSSEQFEAFESPNFPVLGSSGVHLNFNHELLRVENQDKDLIVRKTLVNEVLILKLFPGIRNEVVAHILDYPGLKGVVMETFGAGNAPTNRGFLKLIRQAIENGVRIVNVTQCTSGQVMQGHYETSRRLRDIGVINGKDITTESALAKLRYLLAFDFGQKEFKSLFETSLRGEMT
jgi:L-asparaginase